MLNLIKQLFQTNIENISIIRKLSGGLSNEIYLINNKYIWKIFKNKYLFDHKSEKCILDELSEYKLYYYDDNNICYNYIEGSIISNEYLITNLEQVVCLTKKYHSTKINSLDNFWFDILPTWINLLPHDLDFTNKNDLMDKYNLFNKKLQDNCNVNDIVLCHHDTHSGNIIKNNNKLYLIDLEFSFNNYYFVDLGNIICELFTDYNKEVYNFELIDDNIILRVLEYYTNNKNINNADIDKVKLGIQMSHFYWCIWGILVNINGKETDFDYIKFAKKRFSFLN